MAEMKEAFSRVEMNVQGVKDWRAKMKDVFLRVEMKDVKRVNVTNNSFGTSYHQLDFCHKKIQNAVIKRKSWAYNTCMHMILQN